jgi:4-amino-4-deoxy-L-arabinose transferase-like glycosyltransferase
MPHRLNGFSWDQVRDAQKVNDILDRKLHLQGPRTGIGQMHIGVLHYYLLAPFYFITDRDPIAAYNYAFVLNIVSLVSAAVVFKKLFGDKAAVFATYMYCFNDYIAEMGRNPWNVTMGIAIGLWIFYVTMKYMSSRRPYYLVWFGALTGLYFHSHFSFVFYLPLLIVLFCIFGRTRQALIHLLVGLMLMIVFMSGNIYSELINHNSDANRYKDFWNNYFVGFHMQFFLYRLPYNLIMIEKVISNGYGWILKYVFVIMFGVLTCVHRSNPKARHIALLAVCLLGIPTIGYSIYGGTLSEYYYLFQFPVIIAILWYMGSSLYHSIPHTYQKPYLVFLGILCLIYTSTNVKPMLVSRVEDNLQAQKDYMLSQIKAGRVIKWEEGNMDSYLYQWYTVYKKVKPSN